LFDEGAWSIRGLRAESAEANKGLKPYIGRNLGKNNTCHLIILFDE
jgi:hypothetical protein